MPDSVPPAIGNSFASVVPYAVCMGFCWFIRTLLNIDVVAVLMGLPLAHAIFSCASHEIEITCVHRGAVMVDARSIKQ